MKRLRFMSARSASRWRRTPTCRSRRNAGWLSPLPVPPAADFWRDFRAYKSKGIVFVREPKEEPYGTVAVFRDLYGNLWDLIQPGA
jgi:hypothetical protein